MKKVSILFIELIKIQFMKNGSEPFFLEQTNHDPYERRSVS